MDDFTLPSSVFKTPADYEAAIEQLLAEMKRLNKIMQSDRNEIERLRIETTILKSETERLRSETQAALARLNTHFRVS